MFVLHVNSFKKAHACKAVVPQKHLTYTDTCIIKQEKFRNVSVLWSTNIHGSQFSTMFSDNEYRHLSMHAMISVTFDPGNSTPYKVLVSVYCRFLILHKYLILCLNCFASNRENTKLGMQNYI